MEKSTQKFLSLLLCLALLFSFPIAASAQNKSYEETFTGTYTQPEDARNVLVSGANISEWYGDRVNMNGHTYSVRQNQYGINKDGNMIEGKVNETYTLWLAQYGVASISFTAPEKGRYAFKGSETQWTEHSPTWYSIYAYTEITDAETQITEYIYRNSGYGSYIRNADSEEDYDLNDAYFTLELDKDEEIIITARAANYNDYVYNFTIENWTKENCGHSWIYYDDEEEGMVIDREHCTQTYKRVCRYCEKEETVTEECHDYEYRYESLGNDQWKCTEYCPYCGKEFDSWTQTHHFIEVEEHINPDDPCEVHVKYYCEGCGMVEDENTYTRHDFEDFRDEQGCVVREGERCRVCGAERNVDVYGEHGETQERDTGKEGCEVFYEYYCVDCGETIETGSYISHTYPDEPTVEETTCVEIKTWNCTVCGAELEKWTTYRHEPEDWNDVEYSDTCHYSFTCKNCGEFVESEYHQHTDTRNEERGCYTYEVYYCTDCQEVLSECEIEEHHNYVEFDDDNGDGTHTFGERCSVCGDIDWEETDYGYFSYTDKGAISPDGSMKPVTVLKAGKGVSYTFTPSESGYYYFYSFGNEDTYGEIYDSNGDCVESNDDGAFRRNFCVEAYLEEGETYTLYARMYESYETGAFVVAFDTEDFYDKYEYDWEEAEDGHNHIYQTVDFQKEAINDSCCAAYTKSYKCIICANTKEERWVEHYGDWEYVQKTPQIGAQHQDGTYNYACSECGTERYENDLTCHCNTETWYDECNWTKACQRCGKSESFTEHWFADNTEQTVNPTCTNNGYKYIHCNDCNKDIITSTIPATGHNMVNDWGYAATCTTNGLTNGSHCATCGWVQTAQQTIPATGHSWNGGKVTTEPTAIDEGVKTFTCTTCGATRTEKIAKYKPTKTNPATVEAVKTTPTVKASTLKKKDQTIPLKKVVKVQKTKGKVTYYKASGNKKISINATSGKITLKKGLKKGTYKVKMKVQDHGTKKFKAKTKVVTFRIKVK